MSTNPQPGYNGQVQIAPDSAGSAGTFLAMSEATKATPGRKVNQNAYTILGGGAAVRRAGTTIDLDLKLEHPYDSGDAGAANIYAAATALQRLWARAFEDATHYAQASMLISELTWDSSDPNGLTKVATSLMLEGSPSSPFSTGTGSLLMPAALTAPASGYGSKTSIALPTGSTSMTGEACSQIGTTTSYQITNAAHRLLDPTHTPVIKDNSSVVDPTSGAIVSVDMMSGTVTFAAPPAGPVSIDGYYLTVNVLKWCRKNVTSLKFSLEEVTYLGSTGYVMRAIKGVDVSGALTVTDLASNKPQNSSGDIGSASWHSILTGRTPVVIGHDPDGTQAKELRYWANLETVGENIAGGEIVSLDIAASGNNRTSGLYLAGPSICVP